MGEVTYPVLGIGEKVAVNAGYSIQICRVTGIDGLLVLLETPSRVIRSFSRMDVYAIPAEVDRLVNDMDNQTFSLMQMAKKIKSDGEI